MDVVILITTVVVLLIAVLLFLRRGTATNHISGSQLQDLQLQNDQLKQDLIRSEEKLKASNAEKENLFSWFKEDKDKLEDELSRERIRLSDAQQQVQRLQSYLEAQQEKFREQKAELEQTRLHFQREFENVAEKLLKEKSREFVDVNKASLDTLINPLKENIKAFEEKVEKVYHQEASERNTLKGVITQLMELNKQIGAEAQNLTKALKGDQKKQGNWGEFILEKVLERSGLIKDREYRVQASYNSVDGSRFQPDVVIDLPDNKHLIIDSKVSLVAYERLVNCETEDERRLHSKAHVESLRSHVFNLASKNYQDLYQVNSPDFVLLFVPIEASFSFAIQIDAELFSDAWDRRVVIVSPSTLLATLRTISSMWKQERQTRNVLEIARLSGEMYDKFVGFVSDVENIGKALKSGHDAYEKALNKLTNGRGNLTVTAEKIKALGARAGKQIDQKYLDSENPSVN
jgi:DNA recombination protein RmuC